MSIALVTGTSSGIGLATAVTLSRTGHTVFAGMRSLASNAALRAIAAREDLPLTIVQLDVVHQASVDRAVQYACTIAGQIDVLGSCLNALRCNDVWGEWPAC